MEDNLHFIPCHFPKKTQDCYASVSIFYSLLSSQQYTWTKKNCHTKNWQLSALKSIKFPCPDKNWGQSKSTKIIGPFFLITINYNSPSPSICDCHYREEARQRQLQLNKLDTCVIWNDQFFVCNNFFFCLSLKNIRDEQRKKSESIFYHLLALLLLFIQTSKSSTALWIGYLFYYLYIVRTARRVKIERKKLVAFFHVT